MDLTEYLQLGDARRGAALANILTKFTRHYLDADRYLIRKGNIADSYYIDKGKTYTVWIHSPGELVCEIKSLKLRQQTEFYFQALEPTTYLKMKATDFDKLVADFYS